MFGNFVQISKADTVKFPRMTVPLLELVPVRMVEFVLMELASTSVSVQLTRLVQTVTKVSANFH